VASLFVVTAVGCLLFVTPGFEACRRAFGHDFLAFYAAGTLARTGHADKLYDLDVIRAVERDAALSTGIDLGQSVGPWWNPPAYAWVFAPLSVLPFSTALLVWTTLNVTAAGVAAGLLARLAPCDRPSDKLLVALLVLCSAPLLQAIAHGQNSALSLLLVTVAATAWTTGRTFLASICLGLLLYKPQLAVALAAVLVLQRGWRAGAGVAYVACAVLLLTVQTMPGALADYFARLPINLHAMQVEQTYNWERHATLRAFWHLLLQGRGPGESHWAVHLLTALGAAPLLLGLAFAARRARTRGQTGTLIAATIATAPLLMPFYFDYDLLLLAAAAALVRKPTRLQLTLWAALYAWLFVNPYVADAVRFNLTVPLLWCVAIGLVDRALHGTQRQGLWEPVADDPLPLAQAA
jgi:hypothetical protein